MVGRSSIQGVGGDGVHVCGWDTTVSDVVARLGGERGVGRMGRGGSPSTLSGCIGRVESAKT